MSTLVNEGQGWRGNQRVVNVMFVNVNLSTRGLLTGVNFENKNLFEAFIS